MKKFNTFTYAEKIQWRIRILKSVIVLMLVYIVIVGELGGGDSRMMTDFAKNISNLIYFGGLIYIGRRISANKKLLKNRFLMREQMQEEQDERNQYLHDKSGGIVWDIMLVLLLFTTETTALFNMAAFYTSTAILAAAILLKVIFYRLYSHNV